MSVVSTAAMHASRLARYIQAVAIPSTRRLKNISYFLSMSRCISSRLLLSSGYGTSRILFATDKNESHGQSYVMVKHDAETRVVTISLNRPSKLNALDHAAWDDLRTTFDECDGNSSCRAIVLHGGDSKHFCAGIDLEAMQKHYANTSTGVDAARNAYNFLPTIKRYQDALSAIERCRKPVVVAVHGACIGAGTEMISAADIRYCSADAYFQIKEVNIGLAADGGTLQRFPKQVGNDSLARELAFTARRFYPDEALKLGFVSRILDDRKQLLEAATDIAVAIAAKSPVAVQGTKINLNFSRDHTVEEGLEFMRVWNMGMLQTEDLIKSVMRASGGKKERSKPQIEKASDFQDI